jgi:hypothetical protein
MVAPSLIQLQILDSTYTEDSNGNRKFTIKIKFDTNFTEKSWFDYYVQKDPTAYLQLETVDGTKTSISQKNIVINWKKVERGQVIYPVNEFDFTVTGIDNLPNNIMRATVYMWSDMKPVSYSISIQKTLQSQALQANVPESATIGVTGINKNHAVVYWSKHGDGGSPILNYNLTIKNQDNGQTIFQNTLTGNNFKIENLNSNTNYKAYIIVINAVGNSPENSIEFKTLVDTTPPPTPPTPPTPAPTPAPVITYCVNVYTLDSGGNVLSDHYDKINLLNLQNLLSENKYVFYCKDGIIPTEQQVRDFYGYTAPVEDSSINSMMVSQSVGAFILKDGRLKGEILYIANTAFNPFYYGKNLTSLVQIKSKTGIPIAVKPNNLNFTNTERDERIQIDEAVGNFKELIVDFFVWKSTTDLRQFSADKQIQVVEESPDPDEPKPCQIGFHKDFNGNCVEDDPSPEIPRDKLIDTLKGFLFGTVALSLLARKY